MPYIHGIFAVPRDTSLSSESISYFTISPLKCKRKLYVTLLKWHCWRRLGEKGMFLCSLCVTMTGWKSAFYEILLTFCSSYLADRPASSCPLQPGVPRLEAPSLSPSHFNLNLPVWRRADMGGILCLQPGYDISNGHELQGHATCSNSRINSLLVDVLPPQAAVEGHALFTLRITDPCVWIINPLLVNYRWLKRSLLKQQPVLCRRLVMPGAICLSFNKIVLIECTLQHISPVGARGRHFTICISLQQTRDFPWHSLYQMR